MATFDETELSEDSQAAESLGVFKTENNIANDHDTVCQSIEELPAEIRCIIISHLDLNGITALIRASPVFLQQFITVPQKKVALWQCLSNSLGPLAIAGLFQELLKGLALDIEITSSPTSRDDTAGERKVISAFMKWEERHRNILPHGRNHQTKRILDEIPTYILFRLVRIQRLVVEPLISLVAEWAKTNLRGGQLTASHEEQLARAIYQFDFVVGGIGPETSSSRRNLAYRFKESRAHRAFGPTKLMYEVMESISKSAMMSFARAYSDKSPKKIMREHPVLQGKHLILGYICLLRTPSSAFMRQILLDKRLESFRTILSLLGPPQSARHESVHSQARHRALKELPADAMKEILHGGRRQRRNSGNNTTGLLEDISESCRPQ
ncbi:hypothetical protein QBC44DRAFT_381572 [Cladorrhinum sp. PSN332]|nr:hypothetical protein QBC44DRAFT_381572 [Cladorrhinum sp. PSN332]